jgi:hypothetical protein
MTPDREEPRTDHPLLCWAAETDPPRLYLTPKDLAGYWNMSVSTINNWRHQGIGPNYTKIGFRVVYSVQEIVDYERTLDPATNQPIKPKEK